MDDADYSTAIEIITWVRGDGDPADLVARLSDDEARRTLIAMGRFANVLLPLATATLRVDETRFLQDMALGIARDRGL